MKKENKKIIDKVFRNMRKKFVIISFEQDFIKEENWQRDSFKDHLTK